MRISVRVGKHIPEVAADLLRRRLEFALSRFSARVRQVSARVADLNGPRGGIDKRCVITLRRERSTRPIVIEDSDVDPMVAIDRAADRAGRTVARALSRRLDR
jgi:ribosome-associated translation inhibitor RaiA